MKVLVLGHKGMLGHMVTQYLHDQKINISTFPGYWSKDKDWLLNWKGDFVINCIGAIPQRKNKFDINWKLPIWLDKNMNCKIIHPGTDCEMDNDDYGVSKKIAADYIHESSTQTKILKTSIIGPELKSSYSLLEWFLSQKGKVQGYSKAIWNGNTTLEWSKQCLHLMKNWNNYKTETIIQSAKSVTKFELLVLIKEIFDKTDVTIIPNILGKDKSLKGKIKTIEIKKQLEELKEYYYEQ
jgi:dTDP-4-dehydrorhamnose reductase